MTTVTTSYWLADTSAQVRETTVGGVLREAAAVRSSASRTPMWGEVVAAFVRPAAGQPAPATDELRAHCREHLAPYKTPAHWVFLDAFPMTASGKIQKYKLRETFPQQRAR
jgi:acyl-coenzyme A synthetase/AMP-(fatty) acid ligase